MTRYDVPDCTIRQAEGSWAKEVIMQSHNAMRVEMQDVFRAMMAMQFKGENVPLEDINHFYEFWFVFTEFLKQHHDLEEKSLWPLVKRRVQLPHSDHRRIFETMDRVNQVKSKIGFAHPPEIASMLFEAVTEFGKELMHHFQEEEEEVAMVIQMHFKENERSIFEDLIAQQMNKPDAKAAVAVSLRWMTKRQQQDWLKKNLSMTARLKYKYFWKPEMQKSHLHPLQKILDGH